MYERFDIKLCRVPLLDLVEVAAISVGRVGGFAVAELGEFLRKLVIVFNRYGGRFAETANRSLHSIM